MKIKANCSCYEVDAEPDFWVDVPAIVKVTVNEDGKVIDSQPRKLDPIWEDLEYRCSWCGEVAAIELRS